MSTEPAAAAPPTPTLAQAEKVQVDRANAERAVAEAEAIRRRHQAQGHQSAADLAKTERLVQEVKAEAARIAELKKTKAETRVPAKDKQEWAELDADERHAAAELGYNAQLFDIGGTPARVAQALGAADASAAGGGRLPRLHAAGMGQRVRSLRSGDRRPSRR